MAAGFGVTCPPDDATITVQYLMPVEEFDTDRGELVGANEIEFSLSGLGPETVDFPVTLAATQAVCDDLNSRTQLVNTSATISYTDESGNTIIIDDYDLLRNGISSAVYVCDDEPDPVIITKRGKPGEVVKVHSLAKLSQASTSGGKRRAATDLSSFHPSHVAYRFQVATASAIRTAGPSMA